MYYNIIIIVNCITLVWGRSSSDSLKGQYCTDPRTMRKHAAYTEWADAYSCTRHRCQPGGRNLAIYTVGCKRVEAPESAIECEEVVEDTNMQFPYCCTRLRCLVVVRGEVWTRVLGQPWETLPAAPWSHMYKMKKPPPVDGTFLPKEADATGPVYELAEPEGSRDKVLRASNKDGKDCVQPPVARSSAQTPDIVIALSTGNDKKPPALRQEPLPGFGSAVDRRSGNVKRDSVLEPSMPGSDDDQRNEIEAEDPPIITEKIPEMASYENFNNFYSVSKGPKTHKKRAQYKDEYDYNAYTTTKAPKPRKTPQATTVADWNQEHWMERDSEPKPAIGNQVHWSDHETRVDTDAPTYMNEVFATRKNEAPSAEKKDKEDKPANLQALVDAIGTRMRDIETVVQKMTANVHPNGEGSSSEIRAQLDKENGLDGSGLKPKQPSTDSANYKRFTEQKRGSQYLHATEYTTEPPLFVEDSNLNGYYSDASNSLLRRANGPKEPQATYMAPVNTETRRIAPSSIQTSQEEPKHKKHSHKKKKSHKGHKKHHKDEKKKFNKISSPEVERNANAVSLEDSAMIQ